NTAEASGGGIWNRGHLDLNHVTIFANVSDGNAGGVTGGDGGGIFNEGSVFFQNSIIAGNEDRSPGREADDCFNDFKSAGHTLNASGPNIVQNPNGCELTGAVGGVLHVDPLLSGARPLPGSPAIDAATGSIPVDADGLGRPADGNGDGTALPDI